MTRRTKWLLAALLIVAAPCAGQARAKASRRAAPPAIATPAPAPRLPELGIESPSDGSYVRSASTAVRVRASDSILSLSVNGVSASRERDGAFVAAPVALPEGSVTLTARAVDRGGRVTTASIRVIADRTPPQLRFVEGGVSLSSGASLRRRARPSIETTDSSPVEVNASLNGRPFVSGAEIAEEGNYTLEVQAADRAGNRTRRTFLFRVLARAPELARLSPPSESVLSGETVSVSGECEDAESVTVAGIAASVYGRRFVATGVPLKPGINSLALVARDAAGNVSRANLQVIRDDAPPFLTLISPVADAVTREAGIVLRGTAQDAHLTDVTVNGAAASLTGSAFKARVALVEGPNRIVVVARDAAGNRSETFRDVIRRSEEPADRSASRVIGGAAPELRSTDPADGSSGLPATLVPRLRFSTPLDRGSVGADAVRLVSEADGQTVDASVFVEESAIALLPHGALAEKTAYRLEVSGSLQDLAGNRLKEARSIRFTTGRASPPPAPEIDPLASAVCSASIVVSGKADPGSRIRVEGGAELAASVADGRGRFSIPVALAPETVQALTVVAVDSGNRASPPVVRSVRRDCAPPRVERVSLTPAGLEIAFSEPVDPKSLAADGAILFTRRSEGALATPQMQLDPGGKVARFEASESLREGNVSVTVGKEVTDLAGNPLSAPYVSLAGMATLAAGQAGLSGQVFDDRIGRPLPGAAVTVVAVDGVAPTPPAPTTGCGQDGSFALVTPTGQIALRAAMAGYTAALRIGSVAAGDSITVFDIRLTPETIVQAAANGSAAVSDLELALTLPASSVAANSTVRAASLSPQGLPALTPLGWASAAALSLELGAATANAAAVTTLPAPASASWTNRWAYPLGTALALVRYDAATRRYLGAGSASLSADASRINASIPGTGVYAVLVADPAPYAPPAAVLGQPLLGVAPPGTDPILSAIVTSNPTDVLPTQTADITAKLTLSAPIPSGTAVEVLVSETLTLLNNQQVQAPSFLEDLTVVRDGTGQMIVPFRVQPSSTAAQVALSVGYENLAVRRYAADLTRGNLIGTAGGTVIGPTGFSLVIPAGALTATVPVSLTQVNASDVPVAIPSGYQLVAAIQLGFGGQTLTLPAALKWASLTDPTGSGLIWAEVRSVNGITRPRFVNPGRYDSVNKLVETTPAAVHNLPVPGVLAGDIYLLLRANQAIGYVKGKVFDVNAVTPVASAVVTEDGTSLVAVSDGTGGYALPVLASGAVVRSSRLDTGNVGQATVASQAAGATATKDITLAVTAPYVASVAPATASPLPLSLPVVFTLSEPLNPSTVGANSVTALVGTTPIPGTASLSASGIQVTFTPSGSWPGKATVKLTLSSAVTDVQGYRLVDAVTKVVADFVVIYTTVDPTPPTDINPLLIYMSLPAGVPPRATVAGSAGAACGGCTVIAVNDTTTVTSTTTASGDGSFSMTLLASATDRVYVIVRRQSGGEIRVDPGPFREDGGRVAYLGPRASDYLTRDGIRVTVDEGAYSAPVTLKVAPITLAALPAPMPTQSTFIAGISFDPGDAVSTKPIDLVVAAPPGVTGGQFLVARAVQVGGETKWMVIDTARYDNGSITTRPLPGSSSAGVILALESAASVPSANSTVNCPELNSPGSAKDILDRLSRKSDLLILLVQQQLAFVASTIVSPTASVSLVFASQYQFLEDFLPYVWSAGEAKQQCYFALPVPLGIPLTLLGRDATTGLTIFQGNFSAVTDPTNITQLPPGGLSGNLPAPRLIDASPFRAYTIVPAPTTGVDKPFLSQMTYSYPVVSGSGTLTVKGAAGAVEASADLSLTNNVGAAATVTGTAAADGSFTIAIVASVGDDVTFIAGAKNLASDARIHLVFSQTVDLPSIQQITLNAGALAYDATPDTGSRGYTLVPKQPFVRGTVVTVLIPATKIPKALTIKLSSPATSVIGSRDVKDVNAMFLKGGLLFEVTGNAGNLGDAGGVAKLNLYDATDPGAVALCSSLPLFDFARGVALDDHDRVLVAMGGGGTSGRVQVYRLSPPTGAGLCAGRLLLGEGTNPGDLNLSWTSLTAPTGSGSLGVLPEGYPRKLEILYREARQQWTLDKDPAPTQFITSLQRTDVLPGPPDGKQDPNSPLTIVGYMPGSGVAPSPLNQPVTLWNQTTGGLWTTYANQAGTFTIIGRASSGDHLELRVNAGEIAIVGTINFGIQAVDVNKTVHLFGQDCVPGGAANDICDASKRRVFSVGNVSPPLCRATNGSGVCTDAFIGLDSLTDLVLLPVPAAVTPPSLPAPGDPAEATVLAVINRFGLATFSVTGDAENVRINQLGAGVVVGTFDNPPVYPLFFAAAASRGFPVKPAGKRQFCTDARFNDTAGNPYLPTLAFMASTEGIFVVDVTKASVGGAVSLYPEPGVIGLFRLPSGSATTLSLDSNRGLLYVGSNGTSGQISAYDMTDPCTLDLPGRIAPATDPRRIASVDLPNQDANSAFVVDPDSGLVFGAGDSTSGGNGKAFALALFPPPLRFVADTDHDGQWEVAGSVVPLGVPNPKKPAAPYPPDVVRVLANIWGHAGTEIVVEVSSTSATGVLANDPPPEFPRVRQYVTLKRQSDDPADPGYNQYASAPIVLIADPRSRRKYALIAAEDAGQPLGQNNPNACQNCKPETGYLPELGGLDTAPPAANDGRDRAHPIKQAFELWASEKLVVRLAENAAAETALKTLATYLTTFDLQRVQTVVQTTRADWTPSLRQAPRVNPSVVADEAGGGVVLSSGEASLSARDLSVAGRGVAFALDRFYASQGLFFGPLGRNWDSPLFARLRELPGGDVDFYDGTGNRETFQFDQTNKLFVAPPGRFAELYRLPDLTFFLREHDNTKLRFDATGRLVSISDAVRTVESEVGGDGSRLRFNYDAAGTLVQITDALDHVIRIDTYPSNAVKGLAGAYPGLVKTVTDHTNREVLYLYDAKARLIEVRLPEVTANGATPLTGATRRRVGYTYIDGPDPTVDYKRALLEGDNLLTASNARAQQLLHFDYSDSFSQGAAEAVTNRKIAGVPEVFSYSPTTSTAVFTSRRGHQTTITHDTGGHPVRASFSGNSTADVNSTDPLSAITVTGGVVAAGPFDTTFSYSGADGLTQTVTLATGRTVSHDYPVVAAADPDRRKRANVTATTMAGTGLSQRDEFSYQDLANGVISHKDPTGALTTFDRDPQKAFVTKVGMPATVGTDAQNPPVPGVNIDRDPATGQARSQSDKAGAAQGYAYFAQGNPAYGYVQSVTEQASTLGTIYSPVAPSTTNFTRDARGNVLSVTDPRGTVTNIQVNEADWVLGLTIPSAGVARTFEYDADGNLTKETYVQSPIGLATKTYTYDALGRRKTVVEGGVVPATTTYSYSSTGELIAVTHPEGEIDLAVYDGRGLLVGQQRRHSSGTASAMHTFTRDLDGRVVDDFDGLNTHTLVAYDAVGRASRITTPRSAEVRVDYDGADRPVHVTVVDPVSLDVLKERRIDYAPNGQIARTHEILRRTPSDVSPQDVVTQFAYDLGERVVQVTDPLNRISLRSYDDHGRPTRIEDPAHNVVTVDYDAAGNVLRRHVFEITPSGTSEAERIESSTYDTLNRVISRTDPLGHTTTATYDEQSNLISVVDALTHKTTYGYDERSRRLSMVDAIGNKTGGAPAAHKTQWSWDKTGKQTAMTDANGRVTSYTYDVIGRLTRITYPDTKFEQKTWNVDGTVATATDPNGSIATFSYGPDDQPASVAYTKGTGVIGLTSETYTYDKLGRLLSASSNGGVGGTAHATSRTYDSFDRMLSETEDGKVIARNFDVIGNPVDVTYPGSGRKFVRTFDVLDRASRLEEDISGTRRLVRSFDYFGFNRLAKMTAPGSVQANYVYDAARRLTNLTATNTSTSTDFLKYVLGWANDDVPTFGQRIHEGNKGDVFQHDEDHRLTLATLSQASPTGPPDLAAAYRQDLTLGAVHERTLDKLTLSGATTNNTVTPNLRYGYTAYGPQTRTYDFSGNLTGRATDTFKWDARNRLAEANLVGGVKLEFGYDALGRRVEKKKTVGASVTTTTWVYDGWNAVQELKNGALYRETVYGAGLDDALEYRIFGAPNHDYEIFRDATGSTAAVVPDSGGMQLFKYLPFGKGALFSGTTGAYNFDLTTTTSSSLWQGLDLDPDLGWYYARNRWYDPDTGSFAASDPLGYPDSANAYVWGIADPWAHDPMGLGEGEGDSGDDSPTEDIDRMGARNALARQAKAIQDERPALGYTLSALGENLKTSPLGIARNWWRGAPKAAGRSAKKGWSSYHPKITPEEEEYGADWGKRAAERGWNETGDVVGSAVEHGTEIVQFGVENKLIGFAAGLAGRAAGKAATGSTILPGNPYAYVPAKYRTRVARSFEGIASAERLDDDLIVYRRWGGSSPELSYFFAEQPYLRPGNARRFQALPDANTAKELTKFRIRKGTVILRGKTADQLKTPGFGPHAVGGGTQIYVSDLSAVVKVP